MSPLVLAPIRLTFLPHYLSQYLYFNADLGFISPGLYHHEKRTALPLLFSSIALFYLGVTFAYFIVLVPALKFCCICSDNVLPMTDIDSYLNFVIKLLLVFGVMFEIPVVTLILV